MKYGAHVMFFVVTCVHISSVFSCTVQWRIQNVQEEGASATFWQKKGVLASLYSKNCMKMQYFHQEGGGAYAGYALCWIRHYCVSALLCKAKGEYTCKVSRYMHIILHFGLHGSIDLHHYYIMPVRS